VNRVAHQSKKSKCMATGRGEKEGKGKYVCSPYRDQDLWVDLRLWVKDPKV
jgi:hypothetical protein